MLGEPTAIWQILDMKATKVSAAMRVKLDRLIGVGGGRIRTQTELAEATGIRQGAISDIVAGKQRPYADQIGAIARALGVSLDWLMDDSQDETPKPEVSEDEKQLIWFIRKVGVDPDRAADLVAQGLGVKPRSSHAVPFDLHIPDSQ